MKTKKIHLILVINFLLLMTGFQSFALQQNNTLFETGKKLIKIATSNNPDGLVKLIDPTIDIDTQADILKSFIQVKEGLFTRIDKNNLTLFNVVKQNEFTYFILMYDNKFIFIRSKTNDENFITGTFSLINSKVTQQLQAGRKIYKMKCYSCHGKFGKGLIGSNLADNYWKYVTNDEELKDIIANGKKGTMMMAYKNYLKPEEIEAVALYIKALQGKEIKNAKKPEGNNLIIPFILIKN